LGTVCATERSPSMYIRMRVPWSNTFVSVGQVGIRPFGEASRFTSAIERSGIWKKVRQRWAQFGATEEIHQCI
jgi:hypothetical protein